ncbi:hypothetical protein SCMU_27900 [Sinomonas cyclohexanicum]|uniref:Uncharacterized protein n=1 Tax=Sinomonas cyclohexanicum TaxID=322009 RepID=A0ABN6FJJ4_SINCY|nr:hypothetical protein [Corynebacterium cyclohexanicum]BCT76948.1 hypothetical protein SCMU_27900 [Corynebacterium cyclohexanicum]
MESKETVRVLICSECGERIELPATITERDGGKHTRINIDVRPIELHFSDNH